VRAVEHEYLAFGSAAAAALVGNQALDFGKQDGVTELVENVEAAAIERRLADALLADEAAGGVRVCRAPAFVACVSNFSNFLDLSRKVLRNLELGVPVVVLSRANTAQHAYRWAADLARRLDAHGVDAGMFSFLAATLAEQRRALGACPPACALYFTGSRAVAAAIRADHPRAFASTGGPNTLIATAPTDAVGRALRASATIENAGQCTALRHAVIPCDEVRVAEMLADAPRAASAADALAAGEFCALLADAAPLADASSAAFAAAGYATAAPDVRWRLAGAPPDAARLDEHWRLAVVDVTAPPDAAALRSEPWLHKLGAWLVGAQPISVAVNDDVGTHGYALARALFERTAVVVFTAGDLETAPALTCQARPQVGEVFGEVPPRRLLRAHTAAAVFVPSPTPALNTGYEPAYLRARAAEWARAPPADAPPAARALVALAANADADDDGAEGADAAKAARSELAGYCAELFDYLADACAVNPKRGVGDARTALYGLQTTPLGAGGAAGAPTVVRIETGARLGLLCAHLLPFVATNAGSALRISADAADLRAVALGERLVASGVVPRAALAVEDGAAFGARVECDAPFNVLDNGALEELESGRVLGVGLPLAGTFVSGLVCFGHVKSTRPNDDAFVAELSASPKWLKLASATGA
jgi:hypothetical protein